MATTNDAVQSDLERARRLGDGDALRALDAAAQALEQAAGARGRPLTDAEEVAVVRAQVDERGRVSSAIGATHPEAAARMRHEAEILTITLAHAGY